MPLVRRATIANDILDEVNVWLDSAYKYADPGSWEFKSLFRSAEKLSAADAYKGSLYKALVCHLSGDLEGALYWVNNARKWPSDTESVETEAIIVTNLGYFSHGAGLLTASAMIDATGESFVNLSCLVGNYKDAVARGAGTAYAGTDTGRERLSLAERCAMTLDNIKLPESRVREVLDVAGNVLRRHHVFFAGEAPVVRAIDDGILYQLEVAASVEETAVMTDEVLHELIDRDLDMPGFAFSFIPR